METNTVLVNIRIVATINIPAGRDAEEYIDSDDWITYQDTAVRITGGHMADGTLETAIIPE